ncbi:bola protein [Camillea tinctor]|nr:bola protein [Camillea tinctor]
MLPILRQNILVTGPKAAQITRPLQLLQRFSTSAMASDTPVEDTIRAKITEAFRPTRLEIHNDSSQHAHHRAMAGSASKETHFRLVITSEAFRAKPQPARHRLVYQLFRDEMAAEGGIHAMQLRTMTPDEELRLEEKKAAAASAAAAAAAVAAGTGGSGGSNGEEETKEGSS